MRLLTLDELNRDYLETLFEDASRDEDATAMERARVAVQDLCDGKSWSEALEWCLQEINTRRLGQPREGGAPVNEL